MTNYYQVKYGPLSVSYLPVLDGGGMTFGQQYLDVIRQKLGRVGHAFEYCAGPGFIGFSLLAHGLCERLTLADINPEAVRAARDTVARNGLQDRVAVYESDCLDQIPATEKWDLVVSNPPHFDGDQQEYKDAIRLIDPGWEIHKRFYRDVKKFLKPGASIIFQENAHATRSEDFEQMIRENGLSLVDVFEAGSSQGLSGDRRKNGKGRVLPGLAQGLMKRAMLPVEQALMNSRLERFLKDNDVYRKLSTLPIFTPKQFYFIWSKAQNDA
ncbi:MAG: class I SAM-dependent methyltransferase [Archangiaceae bacterium]|nr:class I SAM-dependent methyltransferase [Archangiaceae bacterium]